MFYILVCTQVQEGYFYLALSPTSHKTPRTLFPSVTFPLPRVSLPHTRHTSFQALRYMYTHAFVGAPATTLCQHCGPVRRGPTQSAHICYPVPRASDDTDSTARRPMQARATPACCVAATWWRLSAIPREGPRSLIIQARNFSSQPTTATATSSWIWAELSGAALARRSRPT